MPNQALSELTTLPDSMLGISVYSMPTPVSFRDFKTSSEIIQLAGMLYVRFPLSLGNVEDLVYERCVDVSYESVRYWWHRFGSQFARQIKKRSARGGMQSSNCRWRNGQRRDVLACLSDTTATTSSSFLFLVFLALFLRNIRDLKQRCATDTAHHLSYER